MDVNEELKFLPGIHLRLALVVNCFFFVFFFCFFFNYIFRFVVDICDLVHDAEAIFFTFLNC